MLKSISALPGALWRRLAVYFYYTAKPKLINPLHYRRVARDRYAREKLMGIPALWALLEGMRARSRSTGCEFSDYLELFEAVTTMRPAFVLECGSGMSTCAIAYALKLNAGATGVRPRFISMEENLTYHQQVKSAFPPELLEWVEFIHSERVEELVAGLPACRYRDVPELPYDFVFVDGPTLKSGPGSRKCFNVDFVRVAMRSHKEVRAIVDQRIGTYWAYRRLLPGARVWYDPIKKLAFVTGATRLTADVGVGRQEVQADGHC